MSARISISKYEELWKAYALRPSVSHIAKFCGVAEATATKYCQHGDPSRGMAPLVDRYKALVRKASKEVDAEMAKNYAEMARSVLPRIGNLEALIDQAFRMLDTNPNLKPPRLVDIVSAFRHLFEMRLQLFELGQASDKEVPLPDLLVAFQKVMDALSEEEQVLLMEGMEVYAKSGRLPDDARELLFRGSG